MMQTGNAGTKKKNNSLIFYYCGETICLEPEKKTKKTNQKENILTFNMMESASGVKGMFILVTPGALDWLVMFLSPNVTKE